MVSAKMKFFRKTLPQRRLVAYFKHLHPRLVNALLPPALAGLAGLTVFLPSTLPTQARLAIFAFVVAAIAWLTTSINASYIALGSVILLALISGNSQEPLLEAPLSNAVWLMIGAFVLAGAVKEICLAVPSQVVPSRSRSVSSPFWLLTTVVIPLVVHLVLIVLFYHIWWRWVGLSL